MLNLCILSTALLLTIYTHILNMFNLCGSFLLFYNMLKMYTFVACVLYSVICKRTNLIELTYINNK